MEFDFSRFFTAVSINILNFHNIWNEFNNFHDSIDFVNFDEIDNLLLEEFDKPSITLFSKLWILIKVFFHLSCKHVNQMLRSSIRYWNLNHSVFIIDNIDNPVNSGSGDTL